jgi:hypothetical protein
MTFISEGSSSWHMLGDCTYVTEHGIDPKGPIIPPIAAVYTPWTWVLARAEVWGRGILERFKLLEAAAGVWAEFHPPP